MSWKKQSEKRGSSNKRKYEAEAYSEATGISKGVEDNGRRRGGELADEEGERRRRMEVAEGRPVQQ
jgi:hypothetical protein